MAEAEVTVVVAEEEATMLMVALAVVAEVILDVAEAMQGLTGGIGSSITTRRRRVLRLPGRSVLRTL